MIKNLYHFIKVLHISFCCRNVYYSLVHIRPEQTMDAMLIVHSERRSLVPISIHDLGGSPLFFRNRLIAPSQGDTRGASVICLLKKKNLPLTLCCKAEGFVLFCVLVTSFLCYAGYLPLCRQLAHVELFNAGLPLHFLWLNFPCACELIASGSKLSCCEKRYQQGSI